jgi:hypothetical protein
VLSRLLGLNGEEIDRLVAEGVVRTVPPEPVL